MPKNNIKNIAGQRFGMLVAIRQTEKRKNKHVIWLCKCDCGNFKEVPQNNLVGGSTKSCGCLRTKLFNKNRRKPSHGMYKTRQFSIWHSMKQRCLNKKSTNYKDYGGRGIKVCDKWLNFKGFWEDMQYGYDDNLTIDRINVNDDYCKENCRWITQQEQEFNKRNSIIINIDGITAPLKYQCKRLNIPYKLVYNRIHCKNWEVEKALKTPLIQKYSHKQY
jgi:hypothetical protein